MRNRIFADILLFQRPYRAILLALEFQLPHWPIRTRQWVRQWIRQWIRQSQNSKTLEEQSKFVHYQQWRRYNNSIYVNFVFSKLTLSKTTIADKIYEAMSRNQEKVGRTRKLWYLFLRNFWPYKTFFSGREPGY